jgi:hypothetical protein
MYLLDRFASAHQRFDHLDYFGPSAILSPASRRGLALLTNLLPRQGGLPKGDVAEQWQNVADASTPCGTDTGEHHGYFSQPQPPPVVEHSDNNYSRRNCA